MKDGTILLWTVDERSGWGPRLVAFFTGMPQYHVLIYFEGKTYGMGGRGVKVSEGLKRADEYWEPIQPMSERQKFQMRAFLWWTAHYEHGRWHYNVAKFLALAVVYPTKRFWNHLGWVPFEHDLFGEHCATYVAYAWRAAGRLINPSVYIDLVVPGDLAGQPGFRRVENK
jgi:hypothetical protein